MANKTVTLSGAATDVLYALFFRGALQSGDLPSKSGAAELRTLGFAETRETVTEYQKENYFTFLTTEGQGFAIKHLVETRFGLPVDTQQYCGSLTIGIELDTTNVQKVLDEIDEQMCKSDAFKKLTDGLAIQKYGAFIVNNGQVFINDAFIDKAAASADYSMKVGVNHNSKGYVAGMALNVEEEHLTEREKVHAVVSKYLMGEATEYTDELVDELMSLCRSVISIQHEGKPSSVEFKADRFAIHENAQSIIDNAIANHKTNAQVDSRDNSHVMDLGHCVGNTVTAWRLSGQMHEAIINAVAESDLFKSLVSSVDAQAASIAGLQQAIPDAVNEAIRNALKPGGLLYKR
ncbi:hypothetical protein ABKW07_13475 [Enterobacter kobei]|uniref:hypothetical protein n=1 Tax=Enterobacter kobei TaxID=208224 RepID=UPI0032AEB4D0